MCASKINKAPSGNAIHYKICDEIELESVYAEMQ